MKFIADSMLGRLARWLRLLGYDTLYFRQLEKSRLLRLAREEKRILLTRDTRLAKVRGITEHLLLNRNDPFEQLKNVITTFHLSPYGPSPGSESRCSLCNSVLRHVSKEEAGRFVPEYVHATSEHFKQCVKCNKFYWEGTHHKNFLKKIEELLN